MDRCTRIIATFADGEIVTLEHEEAEKFWGSRIQPPRMECRSCRWWVCIEHNDNPTGQGDCHRNPPATVQQVWMESDDLGENPRLKTDLDDFWPTTGAGEFCGEWKGR